MGAIIMVTGTVTVCSGIASTTPWFNNYDCRCKDVAKQSSAVNLLVSHRKLGFGFYCPGRSSAIPDLVLLSALMHESVSPKNLSDFVPARRHVRLCGLT
jgi:hypothetical protein